MSQESFQVSQSLAGGGGASTMGGGPAFQIGAIDFERMASFILPHGMQSPVDGPINGAGKALMDAKIGGEETLLGAKIGNNLADMIDSPFGIVEGCLDKIIEGFKSPISRGSGQDMQGQHIDMGQSLTPIGPSAGGGAGMEIG